jgi:hypothetical protein
MYKFFFFRIYVPRKAVFAHFRRYAYRRLKTIGLPYLSNAFLRNSELLVTYDEYGYMYS